MDDNQNNEKGDEGGENSFQPKVPSPMEKYPTTPRPGMMPPPMRPPPHDGSMGIRPSHRRFPPPVIYFKTYFYGLFWKW